MDKFVFRVSSEPGTSKDDHEYFKQDLVGPDKTTVAPNDLAAVGEEIKQVKLKSYPKKDGRCFRSEWYNTYPWLEYSPQRDAAYCYACRHFNPNASKEKVFTIRGFQNWKNALSSDKGLPKHSASDSHREAMLKWAEKRSRVSGKCSISTVLNDGVLEKRRYYIKSIAEVIQFLVVNELALRGNFSLEEKEEHSLFSNLFQFIMRKDEKLKEANKLMPGNALYTSPDIQNEIVSIMAEMVKKDVVSDILSADVPWYSLLEDGTKDKNNRENIAIAIRYIKNGVPNESLLCIKASDKFDAKTFTETTLKELSDSGLLTEHLLSQCFDGASVMSGRKGGVQAFIKNQLGRNIPYIHCSNHRLHLIVVKATECEESVHHFFQHCAALYCFMRMPKVCRIYHGQKIVRLLPQRWSGHLQMVRIIYHNFEAILSTLEEVKAKPAEFSGEDVVQSEGLLRIMEKLNFRFTLVLMKMILEILEPANKALQSRVAGLMESYKIIEVVTQTLKQKRTDETLREVLEDAQKLLSEDRKEHQNYSNISYKKRKLSSRLSGFVVTEKIGREMSSENTSRIFFAVLDVILNELALRFSDNESLLKSIQAAEELEIDKLQHLKELGITIPSKEEIAVVKKYLEKSANQNAFEEIYKQRVAFEDTYKMLAAVRTFPCSTAVCESTFSVLTNIDAPRRRSMTSIRQANLTYLAFESKRTSGLNLDNFLQHFHGCHARRLQLF